MKTGFKQDLNSLFFYRLSFILLLYKKNNYEPKINILIFNKLEKMSYK